MSINKCITSFSYLQKKTLLILLSYLFVLEHRLAKDLFQQIGKYTLNISEIGAGILLKNEGKTIQFKINNLYEARYDMNPLIDINKMKSSTNHSIPNVDGLLFETEDFKDSDCDSLKCFRTNLKKGNLLNGASIEFQILFFKESGNITYADKILREIRKGSVKISVIIKDWGFCSNPNELICQESRDKKYLATNYTINSSHKKTFLPNETYFLGDSFYSVGTNYVANNSNLGWEFLNIDYFFEANNSMIVFQKNSRPVTYIDFYLRLNTPLLDFDEIPKPQFEELSLRASTVKSFNQTGKVSALSTLDDGTTRGFEITPQYIYESNLYPKIIGYKSIQGILLSDYNYSSNLNGKVNSDSVEFYPKSLNNFLKVGTIFSPRLQIFNTYNKIKNMKESLVSPGDFLVEFKIINWPFCNSKIGPENTEGCRNSYGYYNDDGEYLDYEFSIKAFNTNFSNYFLTLDHNVNIPAYINQPIIWINNYENNKIEQNKINLIRVRVPVHEKSKEISLKFLFTTSNPEFSPGFSSNINYNITNYKSFGSNERGASFSFTEELYKFSINDVFYHRSLIFSLNSIQEKGPNGKPFFFPLHSINETSALKAKNQNLFSYINVTSCQEIKNIKIDYPLFLNKANLTIDFTFTKIENPLQFANRNFEMRNTDILAKISIEGWEFCSTKKQNCVVNNEAQEGSYLEMNFTLKYFNNSFTSGNNKDFSVYQNSSYSIEETLVNPDTFESYYTVLVPASANKTELQFLIETPILKGNLAVLILVVILMIIIVSVILTLIFLRCRKQKVNSTFIENSQSGFVDSQI